MKKEKPSIGNYYKVPNPGLWAYFKHNVSGQPEDFRPPLFQKRDRQIVLKLWQNELDRVGLKEKFPELYSFEEDMKSKVGPMSIQAPLEERIESIENYYTCVKDAGSPISPEAIEAAGKFFSKAGGIRMRSIPRVIEEMKLSTNSGSWLFAKRRTVVDETLSARVTSTDPDGVVVTTANGQSYTLVATLGRRGQEGGLETDDVKQRVVFMFPFLRNIKELQFYQPAIQAMKKYNLIPAYVSMDAVDSEVTKLFDTKPKDDLVICTDFTKFDQHFNKHLQDAAYAIERRLLIPGTNWLPTFRYKFSIPLVCSEDLMYTGNHGMGSGSGGTNFDECMAHKALQFESAIENGQKLNPHSMAYGDDGILTYPGINVDSVVQTYTKHGQEMNVSKQYVSKHDCVVLRRWHGMNYRVNGTMVGVYSTFRALGRLLAQERFYDPSKWSPSMVCLRSLSIIENCKWHPYFHLFIDFVLKEGDKYRLGLDIPGFLDNIEVIARKSIDTFQDFLGYTKTMQATNSTTGIANWEVVKYLKTLK